MKKRINKQKKVNSSISMFYPYCAGVCSCPCNAFTDSSGNTHYLSNNEARATGKNHQTAG